MILTKKIKTRAIGKTLKYYRDKGYDVNNGDYVTVDISHLHPGCKQLVSVKCDVCGNEKEISHYVYNKSYSSYGYYSCSSKCAIEKKSKTLIKNFGVDSPFKSEEIQKKITSTIQKKFGVDNAAKSKQVKNKIKSTNLKKYGVENPMQDDNVYKKSKNTKLDRYGDENYNNRDKYKETCLDNFGVENPSQLEEIKQKKIETCLENHGVKFPSHSKKIFDKQIKSGYKTKIHEETKIKYQGTYEKDFLDFCYSNKLSVERGPTVKYNFNDEDHYYFSDFFLKELNLILEIKSEYYFNLHKKLNLAKQKECLRQGYSFEFIIDKDYSKLEEIISSNSSCLHK